jgi:hypothetical protein
MSMLSTVTPTQASAPQQQAVSVDSRSALMSMLSAPGIPTHQVSSQIASSGSSDIKRLVPSHLLTKRKP